MILKTEKDYFNEAISLEQYMDKMENIRKKASAFMNNLKYRRMMNSSDC